MKRELKHIVPYLPYSVNVKWLNEDENCFKISELTLENYDLLINKLEGKLILRPLLYLKEEIEHNGEKFVPINKLKEMYNEMPDSFIKHLMYIDFENQFTLFGLEEDNSYEVSMPYSLYEKLFEWHFDILGLIDADLAVYRVV